MLVVGFTIENALRLKRNIWYCCDWKSQSGMCAKLRTVAASNNRVHALQSLYYCLFAPRMYIVVLRTHPVCGESHIQCNATREVATTSPPSFLQWTAPIARSLCEGWTRHDLHILVTAPFCWDWKARAACAESFTLAASNNRVHMPWSLYYCLFAPHIYGCSLRTSRSWWITQSTPMERLQQYNGLLVFCIYSTFVETNKVHNNSPSKTKIVL